jgi:branched-chain amino acid transport system permease protein
MKRARPFVLLALLALFLAFPWLSPNEAVNAIAVFTLLSMAAATGWNVFSGYTGYISLGHAAYLGVGAYALAIICKQANIQNGYMPFLLLPLCGLVAAVFALPLGWIALRTRRHTFMVVTIAIFFTLQLLAYNLAGLTNGSAGIFLPPPPFGVESYNEVFYYVALVLLLAALGTSWWVRHSKYGLGLLAIRDDEDRALSLGIRSVPFKLSAYIISAYLVGIVGALLVYFIGSVYPPFAFDPAFDVTIALMAFLGGVATVAGPILGALIVAPLQQYLIIQYGANGLDLIIFGALLLAVILLLPEGIVPTLRKKWTQWIASSRKAAGSTVLVTGAGRQDESAVAESGGGGKG